MASVIQQSKFYAKNRKKLREALQQENSGVDLMVITGNRNIQISADRVFPFEQDTNFFYLTGITDSGLTLVIDKGAEYLITPEQDATQIAFEGKTDLELYSQISGIADVFTETEGWKKLGKRIKRAVQVGAFNPPEVYISHFDMYTNPSRRELITKLKVYNKKLKIIDLRPHIVGLRMIKTSYEIKMIEQAIQQTRKLFSVIERKRLKAVNEQDLLAEIERTRIKLQLKHAYEPIIASGSNAVTLHYSKNNMPINKKSLLLLDIGLRYNGYNADISRTVSFKPTKRQQAVYDAVLAVQEYAISLLRPGVVLKEYEKEVHHIMGEKLRELGLIGSISPESVRTYYPHATSHFLGLDVHDVGDYTRPLEPGMILTVEPGIYIPQEEIGVRIEDNILITAEGNRNLTNKLPKNLASLTIRA